MTDRPARPEPSALPGGRDEERLGIVYGVTAYVVWGLLTIYWKGLHGLDAFELIGIRITASTVVLGVVLTATGRWARLRPVIADRRLLLRLVAAALLLTVNWTSYVYAVTHGNVVETALGYFIAPLGTVLVGVVHFGERLRRPQMLALGFAFLGVIVLAVAYGDVPWIALLLAGSWTFYALTKKTVPLAPLESLAGETLVLLPLAIGVVVVQELRPHAIFDTASGGQIALLVLAGVATVGPLLLFAGAAKRIPLSTAGPLQYIVPSINFLLGVAFYGEEMPASRLAGFALVWVALAIFTADGLRRARASRSRAEPTTVPHTARA